MRKFWQHGETGRVVAMEALPDGSGADPGGGWYEITEKAYLAHETQPKPIVVIFSYGKQDFEEQCKDCVEANLLLETVFVQPSNNGFPSYHAIFVSPNVVRSVPRM